MTRQSALMAGRSIYGIRSIGILDSGGLGILFGGCAFSIPVVCDLLEGDSCPARFATKVIGFARTLGVRSIRASSIRAIAIMTNAVETNRILSSPLKLMYDTSFSSRIVLRASPPCGPQTSPCVVSRCFGTAAYIFDCAKHGAIFDRQRLGGRESKLDLIRRNDNDPAKRFPSGNNR